MGRENNIYKTMFWNKLNGVGVQFQDTWVKKSSQAILCLPACS